MYISRILLIFLVAYNPIDSFQNFNKSFIHNNTMNYSSNFAYSSTFTTAQTNSSSQQQTTGVSINSNELKTPHILSIKTVENAQLNGKITVDGLEIKELQGSQISLNLSPYLTKGVKKIEIIGNYKPASSSVKIEFSGSSTNVTQQTSGNGTLRQTLIVTVQ